MNTYFITWVITRYCYFLLLLLKLFSFGHRGALFGWHVSVPLSLLHPFFCFLFPFLPSSFPLLLPSSLPFNLFFFPLWSSFLFDTAQCSNLPSYFFQVKANIQPLHKKLYYLLFLKMVLRNQNHKIKLMYCYLQSNIILEILYLCIYIGEILKGSL